MENTEKPKLSQLFWSFCRIGGLTFGGGYAMLPMLQRECVEKKRWMSSEKLLDFYTIAQCLPGIIAANTASLSGFFCRGWLGALAAVGGVVTPSIIILMLVAGLLQGFSDYAVVQHAFAGIQIGVVALIIQTVIKLFKTGVKSKLALFLCVAAFGLSVLPKGWLPFTISPILIILCAAAVGAAIGFAKGRKAE